MEVVTAWRTADYLTDGERAALALAEALTHLDDRVDPMPASLWREAARYLDDRQRAVLVLSIAITNLFDRLAVTAGESRGEIG